ncbi:plant UBX domain-containing protein 10-like [Chenopodium quinoa]|uniref:UBX domain-containing protein n=1 Tax=Chenopodium quinoa TaxID=63459 RepID=A0A803L8J0_CHEQI|nr:plant UBX domain-containing protein 10-like [Chenopodium quinoa]
MSSSNSRENSRTRSGDFPNYSRIVRRMINLPRNILGGFSRAMGHGIDVMARERRNQVLLPAPPPPPFLPPPQFPSYPPQYDPGTALINDEWAFLNSFEQNYGVTHPFFYACSFIQALKIAQDEKKFMFLYLHSPDHPFTAEFCSQTLCSEIIVQFLDANFVSWGAIADRGEGLQMSGILRPASFPFSAVIAPASGDNISVLQQIEGPVSPAELLEILQRTLEEQGVALGNARAIEENKRIADRRLREEQDAAYFAALKLDQEREKLKNIPAENKVQKPETTIQPSNIRNKASHVKESAAANKGNLHKNRASKTNNTQILIRFPNGERREHSFAATDKVQAIYYYIDSLGLPGIENYRLISSFPRKVYGADQLGMTLKDAGLHPRASLLLDLL